MSEQVSQAVALKAARLIEEGRVTPLNHSDFMYQVEGDHGSYTVAVSYAPEASGSCTCKAEGTCSHLIAACAVHLTIEKEGRQERHLHVVPADPFAGLPE